MNAEVAFSTLGALVMSQTDWQQRRERSGVVGNDRHLSSLTLPANRPDVRRGDDSDERLVSGEP